MPITRESFTGGAPNGDAPEERPPARIELEPDWAPLPSEARRARREERYARIQARADRYEPRRAALLLLASLVSGAFWVLGWACKRLFKAGAWAVACAQVGWDDGMGRGPTKAEVAEENRRLREEVHRLGGAPPDTPPASSVHAARLAGQVAR